MEELAGAQRDIAMHLEVLWQRSPFVTNTWPILQGPFREDTRG